ncbi:mitochondrial ATPase expression-domain-containing protein [Aspergillus ambiguus]|uniref:uncharacterized protein n=1 Tax=Aspergillus ambiguus TaxID=176160 RepID=UPI003CCD9810
MYPSLDSIFNGFASNLATIVRIRRAAGHPLGLAEYTHLLDCARAIGDGLMADHVWHNLKQDAIVPDLKCYNYYMEAKVWDGAHSGLERYRLRVTPYAYRKRRFPTANPGWKGYGTAVRSVRKEVLHIFHEMLEQGTYGDETSFVNVMLASCRVGHMRGVENVLKTVWNVDVDAIRNHDGQSDLPPVTAYPRSSPLHPTGKLLFAIAHAFGTNSDLPGALRTIDFISAAYNIAVPASVWHELLERAFILSRRRFGPNADKNARGQLPPDSLTGIFRAMTSPPVRVRPTVNTHRILAKAAWERKDWADFQHHMCAAYELLKDARKERKGARTAVETYLKQIAAAGATSPQGRALLQSRHFAEAVHVYDLHRWRTLQHTIVMERLAKLALIHHRWTDARDPTWGHVRLPQELEEWRDFLPETFDHPLPSGRIFFQGRTRFTDARLTPHPWVPIRRVPWASPAGLRDNEYGEIDDDFLWEDFKRATPGLNLSFAPLSRLFNGVGKRVHAARAASQAMPLQLEEQARERDAARERPPVGAALQAEESLGLPVGIGLALE